SVNEGGATPITGRERFFEDLPDATANPDLYSEPKKPAVGYYASRSHVSFDFYKWNLLRKYGSKWKQTFINMVGQRFNHWGMNTIAGWSSPEVYLKTRIPYAITLKYKSRPIEGSKGHWYKFPDPFDPDFKAGIIQQVKTLKKTINDPFCIG